MFIIVTNWIDFMNIIFKKWIVQRSYIQIYIQMLIMLGHFKKSANILTDQETQMVSNDPWPATICNTEVNIWYSFTW